jgi:hypothetical protein
VPSSSISQSSIPFDPCDCEDESGVTYFIKVTIDMIVDSIITQKWSAFTCRPRVRYDSVTAANGTYFMEMTRDCSGVGAVFFPKDYSDTITLPEVRRREWTSGGSIIYDETRAGVMEWFGFDTLRFRWLHPGPIFSIIYDLPGGGINHDLECPFPSIPDTIIKIPGHVYVIEQFSNSELDDLTCFTNSNVKVGEVSFEFITVPPP